MQHVHNNKSSIGTQQENTSFIASDVSHGDLTGSSNTSINPKISHNVTANVENVVMHFKAYITCGMVMCDVIANTNVMNKQTFRILSPLTINNAKCENVTIKALDHNREHKMVHGSVIDVVQLVFDYLY